MADTFLPIALTAAASSVSRRPVIKTYAPSFTNCCAVARPMPLLPPVMSAIFLPACPWSRLHDALPICQGIARTDDERLVSFQSIENFDLLSEIAAERNALRFDDPV